MPDVTRDYLYKKFGVKLIEAIVLITKDEINLLRVNAGLPERSTQQLTNAVKNKLDTIPDYSWSGIDIP
ncbi:MAG: hypothetical protein V3R52_07500 [Candidatus Neomarinimicrobiota bacterium]